MTSSPEAIDNDAIEKVLDNVGPRLRNLRTQRDITLAALAKTTGISVSTLSRLESGQRRPTLELLLALAQAYQVPINELVDAPQVGDPRVHAKPIRIGDMTAVPLTKDGGSVGAYKLIIPPSRGTPEPRTHEGYEWLYVLSGRLRVVLGDLDLVLKSGEAAEFDTRTPHWFGCADGRAVEALSLFGPQGERMHLRARPRKTQAE
jgi:transcriptional regulator with XRE-family HTH domain